MRIIPQAIIALVIAALLGVGAFFLGQAAPHEYTKWEPAVICTPGDKPVPCVGDQNPTT